MLLSHILNEHGIESVVLEKQSREYVLQRIRAGVLEPGSVQIMRDYGLSDRLDREGKAHDAMMIAWAASECLSINTMKYTGRQMMAYGQTAITEDLYSARDKAGGQIITEAENINLPFAFGKHLSCLLQSNLLSSPEPEDTITNLHRHSFPCWI